MLSYMDGFLDITKEVLVSWLSPLSHVFASLSNLWVGLGIVGLVFAFMLVFCMLHDSGARKELKNPRTLSVCALMVALNIILSYFTLRFSAYLRIGFGFVTQPVVGLLFGPIAACMTGIVQDVVSLLLNPTGAFLPAYSLSVGISGMFYGLVLYRKPVTFWRVFLAKLLVIFVGNILLNSIVLAPTAGSGFIGILPARILKNLLLLPIQTIISYLVLRMLERYKVLKVSK